MEIKEIYYDEDSENYFFNLLDLAEHYDDNYDHYEYCYLPDYVFICKSEELSLYEAEDIANNLIKDTRHDKRNTHNFFYPYTHADSIVQWALENHYSHCDIEIPDIDEEEINELQKSIDLFTAINKPFWLMGGDCKIGLCILKRALHKFETNNINKHCLWSPTKEKVLLTDRVWQSFNMKHWQLRWQLSGNDWVVIKE